MACGGDVHTSLGGVVVGEMMQLVGYYNRCEHKFSNMGRTVY